MLTIILNITYDIMQLYMISYNVPVPLILSYMIISCCPDFTALCNVSAATLFFADTLAADPVRDGCYSTDLGSFKAYAAVRRRNLKELPINWRT